MATITPKFKLKESNSPGTSLILMKVYYLKNRFVYSTGQQIEPKFWNEDAGNVIIQKGISSKEKQRLQNINFQLNRYENEIIKIFNQTDIEGIKPTNDLLREKLDVVFYKIEVKPVSKDPDFQTFVQKFVEENKITKSKLTIKSYNNTLNLINEFSKKKRYEISFESINLDFYHKFVKHLAESGKSINTIGKQIKNLKTFIHSAERRGIKINKDIDNPEFKKLAAETDKIFLTLNEVIALYDFDLSGKPRLEKIRDLFVIGCNTALRFSDFSIIQKENIIDNNGHKLLRKRMEKGNRIVVVPLNKMVLSILQKYNSMLPVNISNQKMNDYLKEICKLAGFNEHVIITKYVGLQRVDVKKKKYDLVTSHTARRTGATNMYLSGIQAQSIMKITGHKTEKAFMAYLRINEEEHAMHMAENMFFK